MPRVILFAESDPGVVRAVIRASNVVKLDAEYLVCETWSKALEVCVEPDGMLLAENLSDGSGVEFLRAVRVREWWCPVQLFTNRADDFDFVTEVRALAADVLPRLGPANLFAWLMEGSRCDQRVRKLVQPLLQPKVVTAGERFVRLLNGRPLMDGQLRVHLNGYEYGVLNAALNHVGSKHAAADLLAMDRAHFQRKLRAGLKKTSIAGSDRTEVDNASSEVIVSADFARFG